MEDAPLVSELDGFGDELDVTGTAVGGQWLVVGELGEVWSVHEIHRQVMLALVYTDLVNGDNVRVLQGGCRRGFGAEALDGILASEMAGQNQLHRYEAVQALLPRFIDNAHAAPRDLLQQE